MFWSPSLYVRLSRLIKTVLPFKGTLFLELEEKLHEGTGTDMRWPQACSVCFVPSIFRGGTPFLLSALCELYKTKGLKHDDCEKGGIEGKILPNTSRVSHNTKKRNNTKHLTFNLRMKSQIQECCSKSVCRQTYRTKVDTRFLVLRQWTLESCFFFWYFISCWDSSFLSFVASPKSQVKTINSNLKIATLCEFRTEDQRCFSAVTKLGTPTPPWMRRLGPCWSISRSTSKCW